MSSLILEEEGSAELAVSVNGLPIVAETQLRPGDCIRLGSTIVRYTQATAPRNAINDPSSPYTVDHPAAPSPSSSPRLDSTDPRPQLARSPELVAESLCMRRLLARVRRVASGESNVLLLGESGAGKEVVAQAIRANGPRTNRPYVAINAAALPEPILESELFGHERGAFTGATARRHGVFELASTGTLFLDEVGELTPPTQAKLLRVLETGEIRRVGGSETIRVDVRVIAATNRDLRRQVKEQSFREDLFYRLAVVELRIPPLRERLADLDTLVRHILDQLAREAKKPPLAIADDALERLRRYSFPGNVRELRNFLEAALNFCDGSTIRAEDLPPQVLRTLPLEQDFPTLATVEREHIEAALRLAKWNKSRAAALLGIDRKTLYGKILSYGLKPETPVVEDEETVASSREASTQ